MYTRKQRSIAMLYGLFCHAMFLAGIAAMIVGLYTGLAIGRGTLTGSNAVLANVLLLAQFPLVHSLALSRRGRRLLARLAPMGLGLDLSTTTYAAIASVQLLVVFSLWSPSGVFLWTPGPLARWPLTAVYATAWLLLLKTMADSSLPLQTGFLGWGSVARNRKPDLPSFSRHGTFAYVRQPIYIAFTLTLWTAPVWTLDRVLLVLGWTVYCVFGPALKEQRYLSYYGDAFRAYQETVPYWLPNLRGRGSR